MRLDRDHQSRRYYQGLTILAFQSLSSLLLDYMKAAELQKLELFIGAKTAISLIMRPHWFGLACLALLFPSGASAQATPGGRPAENPLVSAPHLEHFAITFLFQHSPRKRNSGVAVRQRFKSNAELGVSSVKASN
jgi:hypothetical protein